MADGWDLHAVVSGCTTAAASSSATVTVNCQTNNVEDPLSDLASLTFANDDDTPFHYPGFGDNSDFECEGLEEIYRSFNFLKPRPNNPCTSSISPTQQEAQSLPPAAATTTNDGASATTNNSSDNQELSRRFFSRFTGHRSISKKEESTVEVGESDEPRGSVGRFVGVEEVRSETDQRFAVPEELLQMQHLQRLRARKQVEKSPSDPDIYVVSYSGEHTHPRPTHRNSLAGTTRAKFSSRPPAAGASSEPPSAAATVPNPPCSSSSPVSASSLSPSTPLIEGESSAAPPEISLTIL
ncbi:hypothetical protein C3L33_03272, partial [Rhododendron williamsianum]